MTSLDLSSFDTSKVTDMSGMFSDCSSLTALDLSRFDTSKVEDMRCMFSGCSSLTALDLSNFDTSNVMDMRSMFYECKSLTALDISNFDTSKVTDMFWMFYECQSLTTIYCNSSWSYGFSVCMFSSCDSIKGAMAYNASKTDVDMANPETGYFTQKVLAQEDEAYVHFSTDKTTLTFYYDRERNFRMRCYVWGIEETMLLNDQRTPAWLSGEVAPKEEITKIVIDESFRNFVPKTTAGWFEGLTALEEIRGLENLNTSEVTDMSRMFAGCGALRSLDVSRFDTAKVTDMNEMFKDCKGLTTIWNNSTWNCKYSEEMFAGCVSLKGEVAYNDAQTKVNLANPSGYFTRVLQAYVHLSEDRKTITFYYDILRADRAGRTWGIGNTRPSPVWAGTWDYPMTTILTAVFDASFRDFSPTTTARWFYRIKSLKSIEGLEYLNTSQVTDMEEMFYGCESLTSLNLSNFDTSKVTSMWEMFGGCESLTSLDLSSFETSKVERMDNMFRGCQSLTALDLSHFNTSKMKSMSEMFFGCKSLTALDLSSFRTSKVEKMSEMFRGCQSLTSLNLSNFDTSKVTSMWEMFGGCESLTSLDLSSFETSKVERMDNMFRGCQSLTALDLSHFNTSKMKSMSEMFFGCKSLTALDLSSFRTSKVEKMSEMFRGCQSLTALDLSSFDTSKVENMSSMFRGCQSLTALDISSFDTSNVTSMGGMWRGMFSDCSSLTALDLSNFDTSKVTDMREMFSSCSSLTTLDLSNFDTSKVMDMNSMFWDCSSLTTIYCNSSWGCDNSNYMFSGCDFLKGAMACDRKRYDVSMANPETGYFTKKVLAQEDETYVVFSLGLKRLTFYYDREREYRFGTIWTLEETALQNDQSIPAWLSDEVASKEKITKIVIDESFRNFVPKTTAGWFEGLTAVEEIRGLDNLNTSEVTDMSRMFSGCGALRSLDVSRFDTLNVKQMQQMFMGCAALTELDLYFFDTAKVTDMHEMFKDCKGLTTLDLSNFQTSEVKDMREMFSGCSALTTIWSFAFRHCFASEAMFYECASLQGATNFNEKYTDARMANPERGYFSRR